MDNTEHAVEVATAETLAAVSAVTMRNIASITNNGLAHRIWISRSYNAKGVEVSSRSLACSYTSKEVDVLSRCGQYVLTSEQVTYSSLSADAYVSGRKQEFMTCAEARRLRDLLNSITL